MPTTSSYTAAQIVALLEGAGFDATTAKQLSHDGPYVEVDPSSDTNISTQQVDDGTNPPTILILESSHDVFASQFTNQPEEIVDASQVVGPVLGTFIEQFTAPMTIGLESHDQDVIGNNSGAISVLAAAGSTGLGVEFADSATVSFHADSLTNSSIENSGTAAFDVTITGASSGNTITDGAFGASAPIPTPTDTITLNDATGGSNTVFLENGNAIVTTHGANDVIGVDSNESPHAPFSNNNVITVTGMDSTVYINGATAANIVTAKALGDEVVFNPSGTAGGPSNTNTVNANAHTTINILDSSGTESLAAIYGSKGQIVGATITMGDLHQVVNINGLGETVQFGDGQSVTLTAAHIAAIVAGHMMI